MRDRSIFFCTQCIYYLSILFFFFKNVILEMTKHIFVNPDNGVRAYFLHFALLTILTLI